ncbi:MAG: hypothetical protein OXG98_12175 [Gemmatimonadetes bacterium]|nr:hypothetical protein [Gemmatimonadota bacterium]
MKRFIPSGAVRISVAMFYTLLLAITGVSQPVFAQQAGSGDATPSHVFQAVQNLIAEINILREELGVYDYPPEAELQDDRAPVHVYVKTLELSDKVGAVQRRFGVPATPMGQVPFKEIVAGDVLANVESILVEVRKIKSQMVIERQIEPAPLVGGKTPSLVYKSLADVSFLLDGLRGRPLTPDDVFRNATFVLDELELIAAKLRVPLESGAPAVEGSKTATDVAQQVLRAIYKVINLETRLGMDASSVPSLTLVRVTPSEVYDATNMLLAEMARIKLHLDINVPRDQGPEPRGKKPVDVFALALLIVRNLDLMSEAAAN